MRNESDSVLEAIDEALRIGREAHVPVEIWHIKVAGKNNWGRMPEVVAKINAARAAGADVTADTYAYTAWFNDFSAFIPPWAHDGGDSKTGRAPERSRHPRAHPQRHAHALERLGQRMAGNPGPRGHHDRRGAESQAASLARQAPLRDRETLEQRSDRCPLRFSHRRSRRPASPFSACHNPMSRSRCSSPGSPSTTILPELRPRAFSARSILIPRAYGTFPRILRKYVREEKALTLEDAIRKFSALPAQRMRLTDRGVLKAGMWADVVIFDPATVRDLATFDNPNQLSEGMEYVLVNGVPVIDQGKMTGALPGKVLRGAGYVP